MVRLVSTDGRGLPCTNRGHVYHGGYRDGSARFNKPARHGLTAAALAVVHAAAGQPLTAAEVQRRIAGPWDTTVVRTALNALALRGKVVKDATARPVRYAAGPPEPPAPQPPAPAD